MDPDNFGRQKIDGLSEHPGFRLDTAHSPTHDAESVDHRGMRIGPNQTIWIAYLFSRGNGADHPFGQILKIYLMHDSNARRHDLEGIKGLLAPLQKFVTFPVTFEFVIQ